MGRHHPLAGYRCLEGQGVWPTKEAVVGSQWKVGPKSRVLGVETAWGQDGSLSTMRHVADEGNWCSAVGGMPRRFNSELTP